jgi:hypothetical protein
LAEPGRPEGSGVLDAAQTKRLLLHPGSLFLIGQVAIFQKNITQSKSSRPAILAAPVKSL